MKTLLEILQEHPSWDSDLGGTDKNTLHDYINGFYENEFAKYQGKHIKLLEIGVREGASLALWREYFPHGEIYGIDVIPLHFLSEEFQSMDRVTFMSADGYKPDVYNNLPNFDIMIDDGPHTLDSMITFLKNYVPKLLPGGVAIVEDVQNEIWFPALIEALPAEFKDKFEIVDLRPNKNRYDDLMFIVRN